MFGYVRAYKPEMKIKDYEAYRGIYCSLCRALGKGYGLAARLTLSYDITMLAVMRIALSGEAVCFKGGRCPFNLSKRCNYCTNMDAQLSYAAAVGVMMVYYKLLDDLHDSGFSGRLRAVFLYPFAARAAKKAKKLFPDVARLISEAMAQQNELEKNGCESVDEAAQPVAEVLGSIFSHGFDGNTERIMRRFGYCLGRWVYIIDAADDIEKDIKKNNYNVFVLSQKLSGSDTDRINEAKKSARQMLNMSCAEAVRAYELCELKSLKPVCDNILYDGLYHSMDETLSEGKKRKKKSGGMASPSD